MRMWIEERSACLHIALVANTKDSWKHYGRDVGHHATYGNCDRSLFLSFVLSRFWPPNDPKTQGSFLGARFGCGMAWSPTSLVFVRIIPRL